MQYPVEITGNELVCVGAVFTHALQPVVAIETLADDRVSMVSDNHTCCPRVSTEGHRRRFCWRGSRVKLESGNIDPDRAERMSGRKPDMQVPE